MKSSNLSELKPVWKYLHGKGEKDTIMTPRDSIIYYKHFLQTGMMSMEPMTGNIKAWVGGIDYKHFQYDHVAQGARQLGLFRVIYPYDSPVYNGQKRQIRNKPAMDSEKFRRKNIYGLVKP
ncbi:hypothetical protein FQR65_LT19272 [Abscondita terminalis]|nr:hypothetical protein FQR65_LT19272 [Abscondita terminalis]